MGEEVTEYLPFLVQSRRDDCRKEEAKRKEDGSSLAPTLSLALCRAGALPAIQILATEISC
jgi:hypothetical protein